MKAKQVPSARRVLLVCPQFHPSVGGVETIVTNLGLRLSSAGYPVEVATLFDERRRADEHLGMPVVSLDTSSIQDGSLDRSSLQLRELAGSGRYAACIVISEVDAILFWSLHGVKLPPNVRLILQPVINEATYRVWKDDREFRDLLKSYLTAAQAVVSITRSGPDHRYLSEENISATYLPNAVEVVPPSGDFRRECGIPKEAPLLLQVANFYWIKNHLGLLKVIGDLPGDWRLVMVGYPTRQQDCVKAVREAVALHPKVTLIEGLPADKISAVMEAADLVLVPSHAEASPVVILEAMSHAKAWVATPNCGAVNDNAGGLVLPLGEFPQAIATLVREESLRKAFGQCGFEHWETCFSWNVVIKGWAAVIDGSCVPVDFAMPAGVSVRMNELRREFERQINCASTEVPVSRQAPCLSALGSTGGRKRADEKILANALSRLNRFAGMTAPKGGQAGPGSGPKPPAAG